MKNNIIILSQPRTGSSLLCEIFHCFKQTRVLYELFNEGKDRKSPMLAQFERKFICREEDYSDGETFNKFIQVNPIKTISRLERVIPNLFRVFKIHLVDAQDWNIDFLFENPNNDFILLHRRNKLEQYVSDKLASMTGAFSIHDELNGISSRSTTLEFNLKDYRRFLNGNEWLYEKYISKLKSRGIDYLEVFYEDSLENYNENFITTIQQWAVRNDIVLERNNYVPQHYQKQNLRPMSEIITNWEEIKDQI